MMMMVVTQDSESETLFQVPLSSTTSAYAEPARGTRKDTLSVQWTLVLGGYLACVVSACFSVVLICLAPGPIDPSTHALRYISDGMFDHCGLAATVMGTCAVLLFACQLIAAAHMEHPSALLFAVIQAVGWNVVLGVAGTGWTIHYVGLGVFLAATIAYHWCASHDPEYGGPIYRYVAYGAMLLMLVFSLAAGVAIWQTGDAATPQTVAVSLEFGMMLAISALNACLINGLNQFDEIHLQFSKRGSSCASGFASRRRGF